MIGVMLHRSIQDSHFAVVVAKAVAALALSGCLLVKVVLHFYVFFDNLHNTRNNFIFIHLIWKINGSWVMRNISRFPLQSTIGARGMHRHWGAYVFFDSWWGISLRRSFFFLDLGVWNRNFEGVTRFRFLLNFVLKFDALVTLRIFLGFYDFILLWLLGNALLLLLARQTLV